MHRNGIILKDIYPAIIIAIVIFFAGVLGIPQLLAPPLVLDKTLYVVDSVENTAIADTLLLKTRFLEFNMDSLAMTNTAKKGNRGDTFPYQKFYFNQYKKLLLWIIVFSIGLSISIAMILPIWNFIAKQIVAKEDKKKEDKKTMYYTIAAFVIFSSLVYLFSHFGYRKSYFSVNEIQNKFGIMFGKNITILLILIMAYFIAPALSLAGNFINGRNLVNKKRFGGYTIHDIVQIRKNFSWLLICSSIVLVMGIITSSLYRLSILDFFDGNYNYLFPSEFLIIYGMVFSFLLLIFYLPNYLLINYHLEIKKQEKQDLSAEEISEIKQSKSQFEVFKVSASILAPIISSLLLEWLV